MGSPRRAAEEHAYTNVMRYLDTADLPAFARSLEADKEKIEYLKRVAKGPEENAPLSPKRMQELWEALEKGEEGARRSRSRSPRAAAARPAGRPPLWQEEPATFERFLDALKKGQKPRAVLLFYRITGGGDKRSVFARALWEALPAAAARSRSRGGGSRRKRKIPAHNIPVRGFAVAKDSEKPWVREANYRRWLGKLRRHTLKVRREGEEEHPQNLCVDSKICRGDLGIPRRLMPQFTSPRDIASFTTFAEKRYGIGSKRTTRRAARLRPSQEEINRERVEDVKDEIREKKLDPAVPLIVSRDGYVIDGHHRWAAYKSHHPMKRLPVLLVEAPARDVLSVAATWGARHHQF